MRETVLLLAALLLPPAAGAQDWRGPAAIEVQVEDAKGRNLAGAEILLVYLSPDGGGSLPSVLTDAAGKANIGGLAAGRWSAEVRHAGHMSYRAELAISADGKPVLQSASHLMAPGAVSTMKVKFSRGRGGAAAPAPPAAAPALPLPAPPARAPAAAVQAPPVREMPPAAPAAPAPAPVPAAAIEKAPVKEVPPAAPVALAPAPVPAAAVEEAPVKEAPVPAPVAPAPAPVPAAAMEKAPVEEEPPAAPVQAPAVTAQPSPSAPAPLPARTPPPATPRPATPPPSAPAAAPPTPLPATPSVPPGSPAPAPARARLCVECPPGESAAWGEAAIPGGAAAGCPADLAARLQSIDLDAVAKLSAELAEAGAGCRVIAVELPAGARFTGYRYEAQSAGVAADCLPGRGCPAGDCRFPADPVLRQVGKRTVLLVPFESTAADLRRAVVAGYSTYNKR